MKKALTIIHLLNTISIVLLQPKEQGFTVPYQNQEQYPTVPNENFNGFTQRKLDSNLIPNPEDQLSLYQGLKSDHQTPYHYYKARQNNYGWSEDIFNQTLLENSSNNFENRRGSSGYFKENMRELKFDVSPLQSIPKYETPEHRREPPFNYNARIEDIDGLEASTDRSFNTIQDNHIQQIFSLSQLPMQFEKNRIYEYSYNVNQIHKNLRFSHKEERDGDTITGSFNVLLPDGRMQIVEYSADNRGYHPKIRYETKKGGQAYRRKRIWQPPKGNP